MSSLKLVGSFHRNKPANLYVKVYYDNHCVLKTQALGRNDNPTWNSSLVFSLPSDMCIGEANASVQELLDQSRSDQSASLDVNGLNGEFKLHVSLKDFTAQEAKMQMAKDKSKLAMSSTIGKTLAPIETIEGVSSTAQFAESFKAVLSALGNIVKVGDELAKVHPYAETAWKLLTSVYKIMENQHKMDDKVIKLIEAMVELYSFATEADLVIQKSKHMEDSIVNIAKKTQDCAELDGVFRTLFAGAGQQFEEMTVELLQLKDTFDRSMLAHTTAMAALQGTRIKIIADITEQLQDSSKHQFIWLSGVAGSGKSTIATSVSQAFRTLRRLGACIRFARNDVQGLAMLIHNIKQAICSVLSRDSQLIGATPERQCQELLLDPLNSVKKHLGDQFIVIIDALDECDKASRGTMINLMNLFIWVVAGLNLIEEAFDPSKRLDELLEIPLREDKLDQLYTLALKSNGKWSDPHFKVSATAILATIALCKLPLTDNDIDAILGFHVVLQQRSCNILELLFNGAQADQQNHYMLLLANFCFSPLLKLMIGPSKLGQQTRH
ncbi:hypothetical protein R3P38DRAFT_2800537 [Favolaschia claudopus]|uniref:C2 domain-containing protein n=1 Tax=Favolaschia claudopus TaxID=2862362 RepID=A0AAV9ZX05_9AGAR